MSFRLVPNSVTLDDLELRNSSDRRVISPKLVAFETDYVKAVEDTQILSAAERRSKNLVFGDMSTRYTLNHKKRDILFLTITLANLNRFL